MKSIWTTRFLHIIFAKEVTSIVDGKHQQNTQIFQEVRVKIVFQNTGIRIRTRGNMMAFIAFRLHNLKMQEMYDARKKVPVASTVIVLQIFLESYIFFPLELRYSIFTILNWNTVIIFHQKENKSIRKLPDTCAQGSFFLVRNFSQIMTNKYISNLVWNVSAIKTNKSC